MSRRELISYFIKLILIFGFLLMFILWVREVDAKDYNRPSSVIYKDGTYYFRQVSIQHPYKLVKTWYGCSLYYNQSQTVNTTTPCKDIITYSFQIPERRVAYIK